MFGVVKTAHKSKMGDVQRMSYQMVNSLDYDKMDETLEETLKYITELKTNNDVFVDYLRRNSNFSNGFEVLVALYENNKEFARCRYFRERKSRIIQEYIKLVKNGKIIQNGDNLVFVGSPYAMLLHSVGENPESDPTFQTENNAIQCFTTKFDNGEYLAGFRSPHNSRNNILHLHNVWSKEFFEYFDLGEQIIALNTCHTDVQDRANGCDFDSDMGFVTNNPPIVQSACNAYKDNLTIVNNIPKDGKKYDNTLKNFAIIDNGLAQAQEAIGSSSNIAQIAQTYMYSFPNERKYVDYVCILAVLAQCAIDNAKRTFDVDINSEINRISKDMDIKKNGHPAFWKSIQDSKRAKSGAKAFDSARINRELVCPMNYLYGVKVPSFRSTESTLDMDYFFQPYELDADRRRSKKVEDLISKYSLSLKDSREDECNEDDEPLLLMDNYEQLIEDIKHIYISNSYLGLTSWLIDRAFCITPNSKMGAPHSNNMTNKNKSLLLKILYDINPNNVIKCFSKNVEN